MQSLKEIHAWAQMQVPLYILFVCFTIRHDQRYLRIIFLIQMDSLFFLCSNMKRAGYVV